MKACLLIGTVSLESDVAHGPLSLNLPVIIGIFELRRLLIIILMYHLLFIFWNKDVPIILLYIYYLLFILIRMSFHNILILYCFSFSCHWWYLSETKGWDLNFSPVNMSWGRILETVDLQWFEDSLAKETSQWCEVATKRWVNYILINQIPHRSCLT